MNNPSIHSATQDCTFFELAKQRDVIFYHMGYFSQNIIAAMAEVVKLQLEISGVNGQTRRKLFSSFIELSQNIIHYSSDSLNEQSSNASLLRQGAVCISVEDDHHLMLCANPIATKDVEHLREKLEPLRTMSEDEIKQAYKLTLRDETPKGSKGAGLGFLTMARDACSPLEFSFQTMSDDPDTTLFCLKSVI